MTFPYTQDNIEEFIKALAALSLKHGLKVTGGSGVFYLEPTPIPFGGYAVAKLNADYRGAPYDSDQHRPSSPPNFYSSPNIGNMTAHQKLAIIAKPQGAA